MATPSEKKTIKPTPKRKKVVAKKPGAMAAKRARPPRRADDAPFAASPSAAGPSGPLLEGHVGAQYLLPLMSGGEARGLPGIVVTRVAFQRASLGHPMDDVIITGHDRQGRAATLELQAKRTIAFTSSNKIFADVVALACRAAAKSEFKTMRYELAVAIARTSTKIEQHIQEVLKWAREYQNAEGFFYRLSQTGVSHHEMREFVSAFRGHMETAGAVHDDAAVWKLLSRFQVLAFDFEQPGSICAQLARERCALHLAQRDAGRSAELWDSLQQIALQVDAAGGDLDAATLRERLTSERGYRLAGNRRMQLARERFAEIAENTLATISSSVRGVEIDRADRVAAAHSALDQGRYLEILGTGGVGKSGLLKDLARRIGVESRVIVVAPHRIPGGGWAALAAQLGCEATAGEFLTDLAGDGGATLFVDGIDRFDDPGQRATVADLIRASAQVCRFSVVVTARLDFDADARAWLPTQALQELGEVPPLVIDEISDDEVNWLANADPALAALLRSGHPAEKLVRNLYRLNRLARSVAADGSAPFSETQMARQWWNSGDAVDATGRLERRRVLRALAIHSIALSAPMDSSALSADAIAALTASGSLRAVSSVRVEPTHDVLRDWAIGCLLYEEPEHFATFMLESPTPIRIVRGVELAARLHSEYGNDATGWRSLLDRVSMPSAHGSWRRAVLLALARSERAQEALNRCMPALAEDDARLLSDLVRAAITVDSRPGANLWAAVGADTSKLTDDFVAPQGPAWLNLIAWSLAIGDHLPDGAVPQFVDLYNRWCSVFAGQDVFSPLLVARLFAWLVEVEAKSHPKASGFKAWMTAKDAPGLSMTTAQESDLRMVFLLWCKLRPADAEEYLCGMASHPHRHVFFRKLLTFVGTAPFAAPQAVADLFLQVLPEGDSDEDDRRSHTRYAFAAWDLEYFPASPARAPFLDLLQAKKEQGLRLVHGVVAHAVRRRSRGCEPGDNRIELQLLNGPRSFPWQQSYTLSRAQDSHIVASALMALEAWAHQLIERGEPLHEVIEDVLGPEGSPAAYLLVAVDVMLSHWPKSREYLWPLAASAELLALDRQRFASDAFNGNGIYAGWVHPEPAGLVNLDYLQRRPSRRMALDDVLFEFGLHGPADVREAMRQSLCIEAERIGAPGAESSGMADPKFAAMSALNRLDVSNYVPAGTDEYGQPIKEYVPPPEEARLIAELQKDVQRGSSEVLIRGQLMKALAEQHCPVQLLEQGLRWATAEASKPQGVMDKDEQDWIERTRFTVAALVMRDGSQEVKAAHGAWAREQLTQAMMADTGDNGFTRQLPYNSAAIAAVGFLAAHREDGTDKDLLSLLHLASWRTTGMASVLRVELAAKRSLRSELGRSLVRLGLASAIYTVRQRDDHDFETIEDYRARLQVRGESHKQAERARLQAAVEEELRWLAGEDPEPGWPALPAPNPPKQRPVILLGKPRSKPIRQPAKPRDFGLDAAAAAQWLSLAVDLWRESFPELLEALVRHCWQWTADANGVGCGFDEEPSEIAFEWNDAYFGAALIAGVSANDAGSEEYVLQLLDQLPEERFLDAAEAVLHKLDQLWLNGGRVTDSSAISIREALVKRLVDTKAWRRLMSERSSGIEIHLAGAVAATFMGQHEMGRGPRCYLLPHGSVRADLLLPMLTLLTEQVAGSTFVAIAFLELLEVEPHANRLTFMFRAVVAWWRIRHANAEFWIDHGIGRRVCDWIDVAMLRTPVLPAVLDSAELTTTVDILVQCGMPLAKSVEGRLTARRKEYTK